MAIAGALVIMLAVVVPAAPAEASDPCYTILYAGQDTEVGYVKVWQVGDQLKVLIEVSDPSCLSLVETHIAVGDSLDDIPQTKKGNPIPGQFAHNEAHDYVPAVTVMVPYTGGCPVYVAVHAVVEANPYNDSPCPCWADFGPETAWAGYEDFPGANWATYFVCSFC